LPSEDRDTIYFYFCFFPPRQQHQQKLYQKFYDQDTSYFQQHHMHIAGRKEGAGEH